MNAWRSLFPVLILVLLFIGATYTAHVYEQNLLVLLPESRLLGFLVYIGLMILATVIAPLSTLPLMPIAVSLWGSFMTAVLSVIGWSIGAFIAFFISRHYGLPVVQKFVSKETLEKIEARIPEKNRLLFSIVLLRMIIPVDILSYALGLFPRVTWRAYSIGSVLGVIPFAFVFAYLGGLSVTTQIITLCIVGPLLIYIWFRKQNSFIL